MTIVKATKYNNTKYLKNKYKVFWKYAQCEIRMLNFIGSLFIGVMFLTTVMNKQIF